MGQEAVILVVLKRIQLSNFPATACGNIYKPWQFSWVKEKAKIKKWSKYAEMEELTYKVLSGNGTLKNFKADHFLRYDVSPKPAWTRKCKKVRRYGAHIFYQCHS